ncbi:hypothetical protein [Anaerosphaera aminiphila]|uniref:hypothetical protein n=1 Tax=Anaerosphaera aminiphila TaxID=1120994 RepID=UPI000932144A|nr:hypothetical protein [Anaerosphaera aminiphila]
MEKIKEILNVNILSKREKLLLLILLILIFELLLYFLVFSEKIEKIKSVEAKSSEARSEIDLQQKQIEQYKTLAKENTKLQNINLTNNRLTTLEDLNKIKGDFPYITSVEEINKNIDHFEFNLPLEEKNKLKVLTDNFIIDKLYINRESEENYHGRAEIYKNQSESKLPIISSSDSEVNSKINLNKEYFKNRNDLKKQSEENKIGFKGENAENKKIKEAMKVENLPKEETKKIEDTEKIIKNKELKEVKNLKTEVQKEELLSELNLDYKSLFVVYSSENAASIFYPELENRAFIQYSLNRETNDNEILVFFDELRDFEIIEFDLFIPQNFSGEFGLYCNDKIPYTEELEKDVINTIRFENVKNLRGIYYEVKNNEQEDGVFALGNFKVKL